MKTKEFLLILFVSVSLILSACSSSSTTKSTSDENNNEASDTDKTSTSISVAAANIPQSTVLEKYAKVYTEKTGVEVKIALIPENDLRQNLTNHASTGGGQYDIVQIGTYEASFWGDNGWVENLEPLFDGLSDEKREWYDRDDLITPVQESLSSDGKQYALPFYSEGSMMFYNKEIFEENNITMPDEPTWDEIYELSKKTHNPDQGQYGIVLRGQPGWGDNGAVFGTMIHAFGSRWFDEDWNPQFVDDPDMRRTWEMYHNLLTEAGQPNIITTGPNEAAQIFMEGKAAMFYDSTAWSEPFNAPDSNIKDKLGYALSPTDKKKNTSWLWSWAFGIDSNSSKKEEAFDFIMWATSKEYTELIASETGWETVPPGIRVSTYENPNYQEVSPFAEIALNAIQTVDYQNPSVEPVPYAGVQFVGIPEFMDIGTAVTNYLAEYASGQITLDEALQKSQEVAEESLKSGGYK